MATEIHHHKIDGRTVRVVYHDGTDIDTEIADKIKRKRQTNHYTVDSAEMTYHTDADIADEIADQVIAEIRHDAEYAVQRAINKQRSQQRQRQPNYSLQPPTASPAPIQPRTDSKGRRVRQPNYPAPA